MSVIHSPKRRNYTSISNALGENENLTFTARGLALYLLCKPENWKIQITDLLKKGKLSKNKLRNAMVELERLGYLVFYRKSAGRGTLESFWQMFETPVELRLRSESWINKAQSFSINLSSPENTYDDNTSDDTRVDIVSTHATQYPDTKDSLGDISPLCDKESQIHPFLARTARPTSQQSVSDLTPGVAIEPQGEASVPNENTPFLSVGVGGDNHAGEMPLFCAELPVAENGCNASTGSGQIQPTPVSGQKRAISGSSVENFATQKMEPNQCQVSDIFLKQVQSTTYASNVVQDLSLPKSKSENSEQANGVQSAMTRDVSLLFIPAKDAVRSLNGKELQDSIVLSNAKRTTKKSNKNKVETDPRATHPAIVAFRDIVLKFPKKPVWDQVIAIVGDTPDRLKLEKCYIEAVMRGPWCSNGYKWVEWYRDGIPEYGIKPKKQKEVSKYGPVSFKEFAR